MTKVLDTASWEFYALIIILLIAAIILLVFIGYPLLRHQATPAPGGSQPVLHETIPQSPVTGGNAAGTHSTISVPSGTLSGVNTPLPSSAPTLLPTSVPGTTVITPVPFSLLVTPQSTSARPGDTLTYTLNIQHGEGLTGPVHFSLAANVLFFSQTYDLGTIDPPFPKSITYDFTVPGNLPSGVTVNGVITATGNGQTETQEISLNVL
jgi:hypothetical protein